MNRDEVTEMIVAAKINTGMKWSDIAAKVGQSKEWVTAACLGQMTFNEKQATIVGALLGLPQEAVRLLQVVPYKGSLPSAVPTDPLIYRFHELVNVYGTTLKELIHEEFGDGIMSAIDMSVDIKKIEDPQGVPRMVLTLNGKWLQYKKF